MHRGARDRPGMARGGPVMSEKPGIAGEGAGDGSGGSAEVPVEARECTRGDSREDPG